MNRRAVAPLVVKQAVPLPRKKVYGPEMGLFWAGPHIVAMIMMTPIMRAMKETIGIKYACNHDNKGD